MPDRTLLQDSISYRCIRGAPGLEVIEGQHVSASLSVFNVNYGLTLPGSWQADVLYERRRENVTPGQLFCNLPGTAMRTTGTVPGSVRVLTIASDAFEEYLSEHLPRTKHVEWKAILQKPSRKLVNRLSSVFTMSKREPREGALAVQTGVVLMFASIAEELVKGGAPRPTRHARGVAEGVREWLHYDVSGKMDLETFATAYGVSRFQVLRAFRQRFGLPPHTYQLCIRIGLARELLKRGEAPAGIAAQLGFADQSHFGRHFKRLTGITPARYAALYSGSRPSVLRERRVTGALCR